MGKNYMDKKVILLLLKLKDEVLAHSKVQEIVAIKFSEYRGRTTRSRIDSKII